MTHRNSLKRSKVENHTPVLSRSMNQEDSVLEAAVNALQTVCSANKTSGNEKDESFCNFIKFELNAITNEIIKDELVETITLAGFEAKKKEQMHNNTTENFSDFSSII
ncbi:hypothetical protein FF38_01111 [Lucilia cuprina]|uniref:Uncharacterized protein n=1 Tax=Lucilia cuprina TaxID=7375 RepID=A0A0L0CGJ5_LUCCU|nr:hypothetical protein FF38_01111 [Lucilia cuprina]